MNNISGKVILITGASSGIGEASARLLAKEGATVLLGSRRIDKLHSIAEDIQVKGGTADYYKLDVSCENEFKEVVHDIIKKYGRIDVLINNAGVMLLSKVNELKIYEWNQMIDVNLKGVLNGTAAVLPSMRERKQGIIVNISSTAAYRVMDSSAVYAATKFAVRAFSDGLRREESNNGIKVCLVAPGPTKTELLNHVSTDSIRDHLHMYVDNCGLEASQIAEAVMYEISMSNNASIDELIISPTHKM